MITNIIDKEHEIHIYLGEEPYSSSSSLRYKDEKAQTSVHWGAGASVDRKWLSLITVYFNAWDWQIDVTDPEIIEATKKQKKHLQADFVLGRMFGSLSPVQLKRLITLTVQKVFQKGQDSGESNKQLEIRKALGI